MENDSHCITEGYTGNAIGPDPLVHSQVRASTVNHQGFACEEPLCAQSTLGPCLTGSRHIREQAQSPKPCTCATVAWHCPPWRLIKSMLHNPEFTGSRRMNKPNMGTGIVLLLTGCLR